MGKELGLEQIQALMKSVAEHKIEELSFEYEGFKLKIKGQSAPVIQSVCAPAAAVTASANSSAAEAATALPAESPQEHNYLTSPIVGTFYAASAPGKEPFVTPGSRIEKGATAFIIESMKVMNEVPAEMGGVVAEVLVKDGEAVEYGQPVIRLE